MTYTNPVIKGFFPDPSVTKANGKYYLVASSFQFFPGVPLFESSDLINWTLIGNVLTRESQLPLEKTNSCSGIFAPTIRYNNGRFYMVTTNTTTGGNFYVYTDDIYGEWSDPIFIQQDGIDPSLYFEDGKTYFMSNGTDDKGISGITQCEIDIETGEKLTPARNIWKGTGGRFLESPHLYKINGRYYIMASEGGTEYGHMVVYGMGDNPYGPFEAYANNPVLTNRNVGGYEIQACGHGDLIEDEKGNFWMVHLGIRQIHQWVMHHVTGRECFLVPIKFDDNGWFTAGDNGVTRAEIKTDLIDTVQKPMQAQTLNNTKQNREWIYLRNPDLSNYEFTSDSITLTPNDMTTEEQNGSPTFIALRQTELNQTFEFTAQPANCESGCCVYMTDSQHYDVAIKKTENGVEAFRRLRIGDCNQLDHVTNLGDVKSVKLIVVATNFSYTFKAECNNEVYDLGSAQTKYLSTEIAGNFTGVVFGLYAQNGTESVKFSEIKLSSK